VTYSQQCVMVSHIWLAAAVVSEKGFCFAFAAIFLVLAGLPELKLSYQIWPRPKP
jgi:hypothetical protein